MTYQERLKAFELRLSGMSWEKIGDVLGYSSATVYGDISNCIHLPSKAPNVIYPAIRDYIVKQHGSSVQQFARAIKISPTSTRSALTGQHEPSKFIVDAILAETGFTYEQAFSREET